MEGLIFENLLKELPPLLSLSGMFLLAKFLFLHLTLALVVYRDASAHERCALDVPPLLWGFMVLVSPILGLLVYWLLHHSALIRTRPTREVEVPEAAKLPLAGRVSRSARGPSLRAVARSLAGLRPARRAPERPAPHEG